MMQKLSEAQAVRVTAFGLDKPEPPQQVRNPREYRARLAFDLYVSPDWRPQVMDEIIRVFKVAFSESIAVQYASISNVISIPSGLPPYVDHFSQYSAARS